MKKVEKTERKKKETKEMRGKSAKQKLYYNRDEKLGTLLMMMGMMMMVMMIQTIEHACIILTLKNLLINMSVITKDNVIKGADESRCVVS